MNKKILLSIILFLLIFVILGLPYTNWGFKTDDFANIYHCFIKSYKDIIRFFYEGDIERLSLPSNATATCHFLRGLYRPMSFIYYLPQVYLFGINPYFYHLSTIAIHAINSVLLFNIFTTIIPINFAFLAALYFGFHPTLIWIGWISAQTYFTELLVLIFLILNLKKYLDTNKIKYYIYSCILFILNIYLKEQTFVLPIWIIAATYIYNSKIMNITKSKLQILKESIKVSIGFWLILTFYFITRALIFPIDLNPKEHTSFTFSLSLNSFLSRQKERFFDLVTYIANFFNLNIVPQNHQLIKGTLILFISTILIYLFIKNTKKSLITFLIFSVLIFSWPAILMHYQPRYIYLSLAFFVLTMIVLFKYQETKSFIYNYQKTFATFLLILISVNGVYLTKELKKNEAIRHNVMQAFTSLIQEKTIQDAINANKNLHFFNLNQYFEIGIAQAMWMLSGKSDFNVYSSKEKPDKINPHTIYITLDSEKSKFIIDD